MAALEAEQAILSVAPPARLAAALPTALGRIMPPWAAAYSIARSDSPQPLAVAKSSVSPALMRRLEAAATIGLCRTMRRLAAVCKISSPDSTQLLLAARTLR